MDLEDCMEVIISICKLGDLSLFKHTYIVAKLILTIGNLQSVNSSAFSGLKHVEFLFLPAGVQVSCILKKIMA